MRKSARYTLAMLAVADAEDIDAADKLEIIETLLDDRKIARWSEEQEAENG